MNALIVERVELEKAELPVEQVVALTNAAAEMAAETPQSILPKNHITRSETATSHLISDVYIVRLRNAASRGTLSNDAQLYFGAAIGFAAPAAECAYKFVTLPMTELTAIQPISFMGFSICALMTLSLKRAKKSDETVDLICTEIESRNGTSVQS